MNFFVKKKTARENILRVLQKNTGNVVYISVKSEKDITLIECMKCGNVYIGVPALNEEKEGYFYLASRIKFGTITFSKLLTNEILNALKKSNSTVYIDDEISLDGFAASENKLFLIDKGEQTLETIVQLYKMNPNNSYIDARCGSDKDDYVQYDLTKCKLDVTVVLTAFKRVNSLKKQLEAIKSQSLLPKKIVLFQDKIKEDYTVVIRNELLQMFDDTNIAIENIGVWGRFEYAKQVETEYVCLFDDDTIPERRWIENCFQQMQLQEGIYGTIGIVLDENVDYPIKNYYRIGWVRPNERTMQVDFVGHSWFLKTKWLNYMFDGTEGYQKYKYAAEDMTLSFSCLKNGIYTYVPPHPISNIEMWGSLPETAVGLGTSGEALSVTGNGPIMKKALNQLLKDGWNVLYIRNKAYVKEVKKREIKFHRAKIRENIVKRILFRIKKKKR